METYSKKILIQTMMKKFSNRWKKMLSLSKDNNKFSKNLNKLN